MIRVLPALILLLSVQTHPDARAKWEHTRRVAETQHEIIMMLIKNRKFGEVLPECKKIFSLDFPLDHEHLLVEEAQILTDSLVHLKETDLAHQVLDEALKAVHSNKSRAAIYKEKAFVYSKQGRDKEAMELFEKALKLEKSGS